MDRSSDVTVWPVPDNAEEECGVALRAAVDVEAWRSPWSSCYRQAPHGWGAEARERAASCRATGLRLLGEWPPHKSIDADMWLRDAGVWLAAGELWRQVADAAGYMPEYCYAGVSMPADG